MTKTTDSDTEVSGNPSTTPAQGSQNHFPEIFQRAAKRQQRIFAVPDCNVKLLTSIIADSSYTGFGCMVVRDMEAGSTW